MKKLEYNIQLEVTKQQYEQIRLIGAGIVTFKEENSKFYIRPLIMKYKKIIEAIENIINL
jgi:hypothetical protein